MGDKSGRKKALYVSVALMAGSTFAMGCLPTYESAGIYATIMLVILRCLQGLSVGGELVGSMIYAVRKSAGSAPPASMILLRNIYQPPGNPGRLRCIARPGALVDIPGFRWRARLRKGR